ncbi:MAG: ribonuclease, partial [Coprothermobacter proteolyticus]
MELIKKILYKISKDDLGFFAGAFSYFMFFSTAALTLFLFLLFGEQVSFSVLKYLSPDYETLLKPVITSLTISARWSWFLLIPLAWG